MNASSQYRSPSARNPFADDTVDVDPDSVFTALDDDACRKILGAVSDDALTATEVSETCDVPLSTTYRKLDLLQDAGLIEERIRISASGQHANEYVRRVEDVTVSVSHGGEFDVSLD